MRRDPIRIGFWNSSPPNDPCAGGIASYVQHRAHVLGERGFEVWWLNGTECARFDPTTGSWLDHRRFPLPRFKRRFCNKFPLSFPTVSFLCGETALDILELPDGGYGYIPAPRKRSVKIVVQCHTAPVVRSFLNRDHRSSGGWKRRLASHMGARNLEHADLVLACSHRIACLEAGYFKVHPDRFRVLFHAFHRAAEPGFRVQSCETHDGYFLIVGNVEYFKGFDLVMQGFLQYRRNGGTSRMFIAGTTGFSDPNPQVQDLLKLPSVCKAFEEIGKDGIRFLGKLPKPKLAQVRARATAILIGSRFEAFTMVAGEAFLTRCPVLLSDRTGWVDLAERFQAARLFSPYDPEDLAQGMAEMHEPEIRKMYQEKANVLGDFLCSEELGDETAALYRGILDEQ